MNNQMKWRTKKNVDDEISIDEEAEDTREESEVADGLIVDKPGEVMVIEIEV